MKLPREIFPAPATAMRPESVPQQTKQRSRRKLFAYAGGVTAAAVFVHCVLPMILAA